MFKALLSFSLLFGTWAGADEEKSDCNSKTFSDCVFRISGKSWQFGDAHGLSKYAFDRMAIQTGDMGQAYLRVPNIVALLHTVGLKIDLSGGYQDSYDWGFAAVPIDDGLMKKPHEIKDNQTFAIFYHGVLGGIAQSNIISEKLDPIYFAALAKKKFGTPTKDVTQKINKDIRNATLKRMRSRFLTVRESEISFPQYETVLYWDHGSVARILLITRVTPKDNSRGQVLGGKTLVETIAVDTKTINSRAAELDRASKESQGELEKGQNKGVKDEVQKVKF